MFTNENVVKDRLAQANEVFLPTVAIGELCYGAKKSGRPEANLAKIDELVVSSMVLGCDVNNARQYGEVKHKLRLKGRPLPENDIWIAALALQHGLILVTCDAYFQEVDDLQTVAW